MSEVKRELSGELIVSGKSNIDIPLNSKHPHSVHVKFTNNPQYIPCNPLQYDQLDYSYYFLNGQYRLVIEWDVHGTREISWRVTF